MNEFFLEIHNKRPSKQLEIPKHGVIKGTVITVKGSSWILLILHLLNEHQIFLQAVAIPTEANTDGVHASYSVLLGKSIDKVPQVNKDSEQTPHLSVMQHGDLSN